ncbi:Uncharacterized protein SCF082_LOCUS13909 [Durusdinium trenchii]|uniref:Uncharacterized protein n=1 Tax=Durusdinium trenchii TaxID=1381693 RepID=A0ABP0JU60_9DINO
MEASVMELPVSFVAPQGRTLPSASVQRAPRGQRGSLASSTGYAFHAIVASGACGACARGKRSRARRATKAVGLEEPVEVSPAKVEALKKLIKNALEVRKQPQQLETFLRVVQASGYNLLDLDKDDWREIGGDLHPFLLPLATKGSFDDDLEVLGLLIRAPNGKELSPDEWQVVRQKPRKSKVVELLADDVGRYIVKRAEEANFQKKKQDLQIIEATKDVYDVRFKGEDQTALDKWLLLEVGAFPDVYKHLAMEHINNDDAMTGLVIADTMRETFGYTWAFPHAYVSTLLNTFFDGKKETEDRTIEGNHVAQQCFTAGYPLWTLEDDSEETLNRLISYAQMPQLGSIASLRVFYLKRSTDDQRSAVRTGRVSEGCVALAKGQALMDAVICGHKSYNGIRQELCDIYEEVPGCDPLCNLIQYFKQ